MMNIISTEEKTLKHSCAQADLFPACVHDSVRERLINLPGSSNSCFLYYTANSGVLGRGHTRLGDKHNMECLGVTTACRLTPLGGLAITRL